MSLAELFYAKHPRRAERIHARTRRILPKRRRVLFEPLEPRLLLSADPTPLLPMLAPDPNTTADPPLVVNAFEPTASGFTVRFDRPVDTSVLNLYATETGGKGPADVTLEGAVTGQVRGSLVVGTAGDAITFVGTGGPLSPDTYTATLRSGVSGFKGTDGALLDGNKDGTAGDDFATIFTVDPPPSVVVSVPDFARGPGQPVNLPANEPGFPIRLSDGAGVKKVGLTLRYDPSLLSVGGVERSASLPADSTLQSDVSVPGVVTVNLAFPTAPGPGAVDLVKLAAVVKSTAPYGAAEVLDLSGLSVNDGGVFAIDDDGVHVAALFGDTTGNQAYSSLDGSRVLRVAVDLDTGFAAYPLIDPVVLADITGNGTISSLDATRILQEVVGLDRTEIPPIVPEPFLLNGHTPLDGATDLGVMFRPQIFFSRRVATASLTSDSFFATVRGQKLDATIVPANDSTFAWLFFTSPLPSGSTVEVAVDGNIIHAADDATPLDPDGDGQPGGVLRYSFTTVNLEPIPNTSLVGRIVDPGPDLQPMTSDDVAPGPDGVLHTADDVFLLPIQGVKVSVVGVNKVAFTDADGSFRFDSVPAGDVKIDVDGQTVTAPPEGFYFPDLVMDATMTAGVENFIMAGMREMYLPRLPRALLRMADAAGTTMVVADNVSAPELSPDQRQLLTLEVQPNSLISESGQQLDRAEIGISTVPPELVMDMLPPGVLQHTFDITVQALGVTKFSTPAPMTFPNVFGAAPGSQLNFLSFDHTTGRLVIEGTATVSADGKFVATDPGTGITHPGWHGLTPPGGCGGSGGPPPSRRPPPTPMDTRHEEDPVALPMISGESGTFPTLTWTAPDKLPDTPPTPPPRGRAGCPPPPRPPDPPNKKQPFLDVRIEVDGPLATFMKKTGSLELEKREIELTAGSGRTETFGATAKTYDELFSTVGFKGFKNLDKDVLFGTKVKITEVRGKPDGSTHTEIKTFDLYRWVDVIDANQAKNKAGTTAAFYRTLVDGAGNFVRTKNVEMHLPASVSTSFAGGSAEFNYHGPFQGDAIAKWSFDPTSAQREPKTDAVTIKADTTIVGKLTATGTATAKTTIGINEADYKDKLREVIKALQNATFSFGLPGVVYDYGGGVMGGVIVDPKQVEIAGLGFKQDFAEFLPGVDFTDPVVQKKLDERLDAEATALREAVATDFSGASLGYDVVPGGFRSSDVTVTYKPAVLFKGERVYGVLSPSLDADLDFLRPLIDPHQFGSVISEAAKEWALAEALNKRVLIDIPNVAVAINIRWRSGATFAQFVANTVSHEVGHAFGLNESYLFDGGNINPPNDIMRAGSLFDGDLHFAKRNVNLLEAALGFHQNADLPLTKELKMYRDNINLPKSAAGIREAIAVPEPELGVFQDGDDVFPEDVIAAGTVAADGTGGATSTLDLVLTNAGLLPLTLNDITLAGGAAGFSIVNSGIIGTTLDLEATTTLTLRFDPSVVGTVTDELTIATNSATVPSFHIGLTGRGLSPTPRAEMALLGNNNLGGVPVTSGNASIANLASITNQGAQPLVISDIRLAEGGGRFSLLGVTNDLATNPIQLDFGQSFSFGVAFDPDSVGLARALIDITTNDPDHPTLRLSAVGTGLPNVVFPDWGNDFVAIETPAIPGSDVLRSTSDSDGNFNFFLPPSTPYHLVVFDPVTGLISHGFGTTARSGGAIDLTADLVFGASTAQDTDFDGLPDDVEFAIGTAVNRIDTDRDGLSDFAEIQQGLDPLGGLGLPTGVVAAATLQGEARDVVVEGSLTDSTRQTAFVATGRHGLAIVDVSQATRPIVISELDLPGTNVDVDVDLTLNRAAVAAGSAGLHVVDVSDPMRPSLLQTVPLVGGANRVEVFDGVAYVASGAKVVSIDLLTGDIRQELDLGGRQFTDQLTDLAIEGTSLFTMDRLNRLRAISLDGLQMTARGSLTLPDGGGGLFVGDGIAYAVAAGNFGNPRGGFATADVSDPDHLVLISGSDVPFRNSAPKTAIVVNGSGRGVLIGTPVGTKDNVLDVMNVTDPANTNAFLTRFALAAAPQAVALASGLAFVADDTAGLRVVNFQSLDAQGQPPTISISANVPDADPARPGIQVLGGRFFQVFADVLDDVQARNVELLVNNQVVRNDVSFPWDLFVTVPTLASGGSTLTVRARATDTGGNTALSNTLTFEVVPDTFPPVLTDTTPDEGQRLFFTRSIDLKFDEALDSTLIVPSGVTLTNLGNDGTLGTADDTNVAISSLLLRDFGRLLSIVPGSMLASGTYRLTVSPSIIADRSGNHPTDPITLGFTIRPASDVRAASGFPAILQAPSANVGQEVSFHIPGADSGIRLVFPTIDSEGATSTRQVAPSRIDSATGMAFFIVPPDANTGDVNTTHVGASGFASFPNWDVTDGSVDLFGPGFFDLLPGNGLYVNLDGGNTRNAGRLESKRTFALDPGTYQLSFALAGSQRGDTNTVTVSLGTAFSEPITLNSSAPFTTFARTITVVAPTSGKLVFDHAGGDSSGLLLDNVRLTNTTTGSVLLDDDFNFGFPDGAFLLQIVPTLTDVDQGALDVFHGGGLRLGGSGFIEGGVTINFGSVSVVDTGPSSGPDVSFFQKQQNINLTVPADAPFGPITVSTLGGTSAAFPLTLERIVAVAARGTAADPTKPSANPGQTIVLQGSGFDPTTDVVFPTVDSAGNRSERVVRPVAVNDAGTELTVIVPVDVAVTGDIGLVGDRNDRHARLQIVPVVEDADVLSVASDGSSAFVQLRGAGFVEGDADRVSTYTFGTVAVTDSARFAGPDVFDNSDAVNLTLPLSEGAFGPVTVTTEGGTSAPFTVAVTGLEGTALSGTPADGTKPSANPGQVVTLTGSGLSTSTDIVAQHVDPTGIVITELLNPTVVNLAGTRATVLVPDRYNGRFPVHVLGATAALELQVVPVVDSADVSGVNSLVTLRGRGFEEGDTDRVSTYTFGTGVVTDSARFAGPDVFFDGSVNLTLPVQGPGTVTVQTAGGTSAPVAWNVVNPGQAQLVNVALNTTANELLVASVSTNMIHRIDPATGQPLGSFAIPGGNSSKVGLQILPGAMTLHDTASNTNVSVAAGSLLVTNGAPFPDRVIAVNATSGAPIASLTLAENLDAVAGVFHAGEGAVFLLDPNANKVVRVNPLTGAVVSRFDAPFDINSGGLAVHPTTGNLWVASSQSTAVAELRPDGTLVRQVDLSGQSVSLELSGLVFRGARLLASSTRGVVYDLDLAAVEPGRPTLTRITAVAGAGTPADAGQASANVGQVIELVGTNFRPVDLQVQFPTRDQFGNEGRVAVAPLAVSADGTRAQVIVPNLATTGDVRVNAVGSQNLGFNSSVNDAIYRGITIEFTPASATAVLQFGGGLQFVDDESWGLDNVRVTQGGTEVFADDFEAGAKAAWASGRTEGNASFTRFSGRFSAETQTLTLTGLVAGQPHRLTFDLDVIDSWDGGNPSAGPDFFDVFVDGQRKFHETFSNVSRTDVQTFGASAPVPLQIVPVITGLNGRPGLESTFDFLGSGFMEGASTITIGGVSFGDPYTNLADFDVFGARNDTYHLVAPLTTEGPIRVTTAGGSFQIPGPTFAAPAFVDFTGLEARAGAGRPADPAVASANTGQDIVLLGQRFTGGTLVQFEAVDDTGAAGVLTRTGTPSADGRRLTVNVPALARTGLVRVVGDDTAIRLQIVPTLRSVGAALTAGTRIVLEGTGLIEGDLGVTIDGQAASGLDVATTVDRGVDQQIAHATVPAGVSAGVIRVSTAGGSFTLRAASTIAPQAPVSPRADVGDALATSTTLALPLHSRATVSQTIGDGAFGSKDVDIYRFTASVGDTLTVELSRLVPSSFDSGFLRLFDAAGLQLSADASSGPNSTPRIAFFHLPPSAAATYFIGVSGFRNTAYDPGVAGSGSLGGTGTYTLTVERLDDGRSSLMGIVGTAASGTPADSGIASANPGQTIRLTGSGLRSDDRVVFTSSEGSQGALGTTTVNPASVASDGTSLDVVVPANAASGMLRLARENTGRFLLIVPTLTDVQTLGTLYHGGTLRLVGSGFVEGGSTVNFGAAPLADTGPLSGVDVFGLSQGTQGLQVNGVPVGVPPGPLSVSTRGGTSVAFPLTFTGIIAAAQSGAPANPALPSANPGQAITLTGTGFDLSTDVLFRTIDSNATQGERIVHPIAVNNAGTELTVLVPSDQANTGPLGIVGDATAAELALQIVPVVDSIDAFSLAQDGSSVVVRLRGRGFIEDSNSLYTFGTVTVADPGANSGPNVFRQAIDNDTVDVTLPLSPGAFGAITVSTAGGTSAPFSGSFTGITGVAFSGTPAEATQASANPGQAIVLTGTGLTTGTDVFAQFIDSNGTPIHQLLNPSEVSGGGTQATLIVPSVFTGAFPVRILGASFQPLLQIVPMVESVDVTGTNFVTLRGKGFLEGNNSVYTFDGGVVTDPSAAAGPDVGRFAHDNDTVNLTLPVAGTGTLTVRTTGGTSAPFAWNIVSPNQGPLADVAFDGTTLWVASVSTGRIHRINPATGAELGSFPIPVQTSNILGLQSLPPGLTLHDTASNTDVVIPAGSLLVTNGGLFPDRVIAVNPTTGAILASLNLANEDPVAGVFHPGTGHLFLLNRSGNGVVRVNPATGAVVSRFAAPFGISFGGLAVHPTTGNLWIGSSQDNRVAEVDPATGTVVKFVDLAPQSISNEISGLAFRSASDLFVSSTRGVVYVVPDPVVNVPTTLSGTPGSTVTVPVNIDNADGLESVDLQIGYNPTVLEVLAVRPGSVMSGAILVSHLTGLANATEALTVSMRAATPHGSAGGSLLEVNYRIKLTAAVGPALVDLRQVTLNEGRFVLTPLPVAGPDPTDGLITIVPVPGLTPPVTRAAALTGSPVADAPVAAGDAERGSEKTAPAVPASADGGTGEREVRWETGGVSFGSGLGRPPRDMSAAGLIDWFGGSRPSIATGPGVGASSIRRSTSPWLRPFLLDLAAPTDPDPNGDIRVTISRFPDLEPAVNPAS